MDISSGGFLTATALLAAILLVWAQLWINTYRIYKDRIKSGEKESYKSEKSRKGIELITSLWLAWVYLAILFAILAFTTTFIACFINDSSSIPRWALIFLATALSMTVLQIIQSVLSVCFKFWKEKDFDQPSRLPNKRLAKGITILPVLFLSFSIAAILSTNYYLLIGNLVFILLVIAGLLIFKDN